MPVRRIFIALTCGALLASVLSATSVSSAAAPSVAPAVAPVPANHEGAVGRPPQNYVIPATSFFSFPNRTRAERTAIRSRVLRSINSTWGGPKTPGGIARDGNGTIRMTTWSFKDWTVARALVNARTRGVSVQIVAARSTNSDNAAWQWLKRRLGQRLYVPGHPETRDKVSFARDCRGSCRGPGGTAHSKYFMFDNVGQTAHARKIVIQTSMNLTPMGYQGQWNQAEVSNNSNPGVYDSFMEIFRQTRIGRRVSPTYRNFQDDNVKSSFYPKARTRAGDPVMLMLNKVDCTGATDGGNANNRTRIRIIQYSIYGDRGVWIAKKLRSLWSRGCDIKMIYAVSSRPVISILRNRSGRGPIPLRQSVMTNRRREIVKYNHSKWMTVAGKLGGVNGSFRTMSGSANWSIFAFSGDEQVQEIDSRVQAARHIDNFNRTWSQRSSHAPGFGIKGQEGRIAAERIWIQSIPQEPTWGKGIYKYLSPAG